MDCDQIAKSGYLYTHVAGFLKLKQSWTRKYCVLFKRSLSGIQRLEIFETEESFSKKSNSPIRIIPLNDCHKLVESPQRSQQNVIEIRSKDSIHLLSAESVHEMNEWLNSLRLVAFQFASSHGNGVTQQVDTDKVNSKQQQQQQSMTKGSVKNEKNSPNENYTKSSSYSNGITKSDSSALVNRPSSMLIDECVILNQQEENSLYSSLDSPQMFRVKISDSGATERCKLSSDQTYILILTSMSISLAEESSTKLAGKILWTWPYRHIRRYGCTKEGFSLEAGRKCFSGDGLFAFISSEGSAIFKCVASHVNNLKMTPFEDGHVMKAIHCKPTSSLSSASVTLSTSTAICTSPLQQNGLPKSILKSSNCSGKNANNNGKVPNHSLQVQASSVSSSSAPSFSQTANQCASLNSSSSSSTSISPSSIQLVSSFISHPEQSSNGFSQKSAPQAPSSATPGNGKRAPLSAANSVEGQLIAANDTPNNHINTCGQNGVHHQSQPQVTFSDVLDTSQSIHHNGYSTISVQAECKPPANSVNPCRQLANPAAKPARKLKPNQLNDLPGLRSPAPKLPPKRQPEVVYEDPIFVSREELFGLSIQPKGENYYEIPINGHSIQVTVSDVGERQIDVKMNGLEKCSKTHPHTISRLTAMIRSIFLGNLSNLVNQRKSVRIEQILPVDPEGSYNNSPPKEGPPLNGSTTSSDSSVRDFGESPYSEISDDFTSILESGKSCPPPPLAPKSESLKPVMKSRFDGNHNGASHPEALPLRRKVNGVNPSHYVQNNDEYALVMKRSISCGKL